MFGTDLLEWQWVITISYYSANTLMLTDLFNYLIEKQSRLICASSWMVERLSHSKKNKTAFDLDLMMIYFDAYTDNLMLFKV